MDLLTPVEVTCVSRNSSRICFENKLPMFLSDLSLKMPALAIVSSLKTFSDEASGTCDLRQPVGHDSEDLHNQNIPMQVCAEGLKISVSEGHELVLELRVSVKIPAHRLARVLASIQAPPLREDGIFNPRKIDPVDGQAYSFQELFHHYQSTYTEDQISRYWSEICTEMNQPEPSDRGGEHNRGFPTESNNETFPPSLAPSDLGGEHGRGFPTDSKKDTFPPWLRPKPTENNGGGDDGETRPRLQSTDWGPSRMGNNVGAEAQSASLWAGELANENNATCGAAYPENLVEPKKPSESKIVVALLGTQPQLQLREEAGLAPPREDVGPALPREEVGPAPNKDSPFSHISPPDDPSKPRGKQEVTDRRIIERMAATPHLHQGFTQVSTAVPKLIADSENSILTKSVEIFGSLSFSAEDSPAQHRRPWAQDWGAYYVNSRSAVHFMVEMQPGVPPAALIKRLLKNGTGYLYLVGQVQVNRFGRGFTGQAQVGLNNLENDHCGSQYTLKVSKGTLDSEGEDHDDPTEIYFDITCFEQPLHFDRFKKRQVAFRRIFWEVRLRMESQYGCPGAVGFDAYIHLLKAFAHKVPGNALTSFQAIVIGLFTLQISHFRIAHSHSISQSFFEGFLRFCYSFYGETSQRYWYKNSSIDISGGGRWLQRVNQRWNSEVYLWAIENEMNTAAEDRMNIADSLDPARVSKDAHVLLVRTFWKPKNIK